MACYIYNCFLIQKDVIRYDIVDDASGQEASDIFWLNPENGVVMAVKPIADSQLPQYAVCLLAALCNIPYLSH